MTKFKRLMMLGVVSVLGLSFLLTNNMVNSKGKASEKDKFIVFGPVDYWEDEDYDYEAEDVNDYEDEDDSDDDGSWLENFIKTHKTPFSKTIHKE